MLKTLSQSKLISVESQVPQKKNLYLSVKKTLCNKDFRFKPRRFIREFFRKIDRVVLNELIGYDQRYKFTYVSQSTIAASVGYTRQEVNQSIGRLQSYGLLSTIYRHRNTSVYFVSSLLRMKRVITKIGSLITSCWNYIRNDLTPLNLKLSSKLNYKEETCTRSNLTYISKKTDSKNECDLPNLTKPNLSRPLPVCLYKKTQRRGPAFAKATAGRHVLYKKKGRETKDEILKIVKVIEEIAKTIDLTQYGKASLSIFPTSALKQAHATLLDSHKRGKRIHDPFSFLWSLAHKATKAKGLDVNYSLFDKYKFNKETEEPTTSNSIHIPQGQRKMHQSYQPWQKQEEKYDLQRELDGYETAEKSTQFTTASSIFGEEIMAKLFKRCKHNVITKAMQYSSEP